MPIYEYKCEKCGGTFDAMQKFSDAPLTECRTCGGPVQKLISQTSFSLKGNGWYQQGYSGGTQPAACAQSQGGGSEGCAGCPKAANE